MNNVSYITPVVTALTSDMHPDIEANKAVWEYLIRGGVDGILLLGSTGEFYSLSMEERKALVKAAKETIGDRTRLLVGVSSTNFYEVTELADYAWDQGIREVLLISPYYFGLDSAQLEAYYDGAAEKIRQDIIIYNYPGRTNQNVSAENIYNLRRRHENIVGVKDTVEVIGHTREILQKMRPEFPDFQVYSGYDDHFMHNVLSGGNGNIGGLSNIMPEKTSAFARALREGKLEEAAGYQKLIDGMMEIYAIASPYIIAAKKAMQMRGVPIGETCAFPYGPADEAQTEKVRRLLARYGLIEA